MMNAEKRMSGTAKLPLSATLVADTADGGLGPPRLETGTRRSDGLRRA